MALSATTRRDLERELAHLREMRTALESRIKAIEAVVSVEPASDSAEMMAPVDQKPARAAKAKSAPRAHRKRRKSKPLSATISDIVHQTPGLQSGEVTRRLMESGFQLRGKTPLRRRVYTELRNLTKRGRLVKDLIRGYMPAVSEQV